MLATTLDKNCQSVAPQSRVSVRYPICPSPSYLLNNPSKNLSRQSMSLSNEHLSNNNLQTTTGSSFSHQIGAMWYKNIEFVKDIIYFNSNLVIKPRSYISILICCKARWRIKPCLIWAVGSVVAVRWHQMPARGPDLISDKNQTSSSSSVISNITKSYNLCHLVTSD